MALSLATALTGVPPAQAFPIVPAPTAQVSDVLEVQYRGNPRSWSGDSERDRWIWFNRRHRYNREFNRGYNRRAYNRHRYNRYRYHRDDDDDDFGAALGGFAAGAIIGGLLSQPRYYGPPAYYGPPRVRYGGNSHTSWCYSRYRSYRAYDNTFQPYYGPRRPCISPYL